MPRICAINYSHTLVHCIHASSMSLLIRRPLPVYPRTKCVLAFPLFSLLFHSAPCELLKDLLLFAPHPTSTTVVTKSPVPHFGHDPNVREQGHYARFGRYEICKPVSSPARFASGTSGARLPSILRFASCLSSFVTSLASFCISGRYGSTSGW